MTIAQLKQTQKKVIKSQKYLAVEKIASGINHQVDRPLNEINTSLAEIKQFGEASLQNLPTFLAEISPEQRKYFVALLKQAQNNNINLLLTAAEKQELKNKITTKLDKLQLEKNRQSSRYFN